MQLPEAAGDPEKDFFVDPQRCIGCRACVAACAECSTHRGVPMIHLDFFDREQSVKTAPVVCMHCDLPSCAATCPADAIKRTEDGVVQSSLSPRCIGCSNCEVACPFGVPKIMQESVQMMKCDMCYDRTSAGLKPMCATVCPSQALYFGPRTEIEKNRQNKPVNTFQFGHQTVTTKVYLMTPDPDAPLDLDVVDFISQPELGEEAPWA